MATRGADGSELVLTSGEVGERLEVSQQAASNYLSALANGGYIHRALGGRRQRIRLAPKGLETLRKDYYGLKRIFEGPNRMKMTGIVTSGLGEGRYYLSQPGYLVQFAERLGYQPYPGTLNVRVTNDVSSRASAIRSWHGIRINGFAASGRTFGGATCFPARLGGRPSHLILPDRTHYTDVLEFIAPEFLREALALKDGSSVTMEVEEGS